MQEQLSQMENSTQSDISVISQITALTNIVRNLENCMDANDGNGEGQQQIRGKGRGIKNHQRKTVKYCWTHGNSGHNGNSCKNKRTGHTINVSFQNKQGESYKNCAPAT